jgi:hypothetical protein
MPGRKIVITTLGAAAALAGGIALPAQALAATVSPSAAARACDRSAWQSGVQGAPEGGVSAGSRSGDYLWHDTHGFRLRVTHPRHDQRVYSGVITSSAAMRVERVKLEKGDSVKVAANRRSLSFVFANHGYIDGINFHTDCASTVTVSRLHIGNHDQSRTQVYLGKSRSHPAHVPFTVHRRKPAAPGSSVSSTT